MRHLKRRLKALAEAVAGAKEVVFLQGLGCSFADDDSGEAVAKSPHPRFSVRFRFS